DVDGEGKVLIQNLDVVAGVFLRRKRIELAADGIHSLRDVFRGARVGALEQHVLDKMRDAAVFFRFVTRPAREPHAQADRAYVAHRFSHETNPVVECVANNHGSGKNAVQTDGEERVESELETILTRV